MRQREEMEEVLRKVKADHLIASALGLASFLLLAFFSARSFTWIYMSGSDSGDLITVSRWWYVGHPTGFPAYAIVGHGLNLLPGDLITKLSLVLSAAPVAATIFIIYLWSRQIGAHRFQTMIGALSIIGAVVVWSFATVIGLYALNILPITLAVYLWYNHRYHWAGLVLGVGLGFHFLPIVAGVLLFIIAWRKRQPWRGAALIMVAVASAFQGIEVIIMALSSWRIQAGPFTIGNWVQWFAQSSSFLGGLPFSLLPERTRHLFALLTYSLALLWVPAIWGIVTRASWIALFPLAFILLWWTWADPSVWAYLIPAFPFLGLFIALGLSRMGRVHVGIAAATVSLLILANVHWYNLAALTDSYGQTLWFDGYETPMNAASLTQSQLADIPPGSIVVAPASQWSLALTVYMTAHPEADLVPVLFPYIWMYEWEREWLQDKYNLSIIPDKSFPSLIKRTQKVDSRSWYLLGPSAESNIASRCQLAGIGEPPLVRLIVTCD